ncbi:hypothetical protein ACJ5H2_13570 [Nocardioides sp. R1-1]|uniref:hypothetical protein n=1 Tax=Nocardioides sp. R1-1 TaxID=3383502 RepID=UPI0038D2073E
MKPYAGRSSTGPIYGAPFALQCMAQGGVRQVRGPDGNERVSSLTLYAPLEAFGQVPAGSQVTHNGDTTTVILCIPHDDGGLGTPQHTEVICE